MTKLPIPKMDTQTVRLADVLFIAPFLVYVGIVAKDLSNVERATLIFLGTATFLYNAHNYLNVQEGKQPK